MTVSGPCHVLVCVTGTDSDLLLVRSGGALAQRLGGRLSVLYAFVLGAGRGPRPLLDRVRAVSRAAGAALIELPAFAKVDGITEYAKSRAVTHVVLSDTPRNRWTPWRQSLSCRLAERLPDVDLLVINCERVRSEFATTG